MDRRIRNSSSRINPLARFVPLCALLFFGHANSLVASTGISLVQHKGKDGGTNTTASVAFSSPNTAGNFIAVAIRGGLSSSQVFTVKDSNGNIYKKAVQIGFTSSAVTSAVYYAENIKSGANSVTVSMTVSAPLRFAILEYSGVATSNSLDATAAATGTGTAVSSGSATTTINGDLLFGSASTVDGATYTAGTGYTIRDSVPSGAGAKLITEDRIQASAGTASATATLAASDGWGALLAAFKPAGGVAAPNITSLNPTFGPVGTSVTITGLNFGASQGTSTVTFNGNAATPTSWSATSIVVPVPNAATTGNVIVTVSGVTSNGALFTVIVPPSITNLSPTFAPLGASVTITGSNFGASQGTSTVTFNGVAATPTSWSTTSITAPVPNGATTGNVIVTVSGLASNAVAFGVAPSITSISPTSGPTGTSVTITGTSFGATQGTSTVTFGANTATPTSWSNTTIVAPVPAGATTGNVIVMVNGIGSNRVLFTVTPAITSLNPTSGPVGTSVTITGSSFGSAQGSSTVTFNGTAATPTSWSATSIVVPVPSGATTGNVVVTVGGLASNATPFTVLVPPSITSLNPTSGPVGTSVTIVGTNFGASQGTSTVTFNGTAATPTSWQAAAIAVPVPTGATTGNVVVTVSGLASNGVLFTVPPPPAITSLNPTSGPVNTRVTITGSNFGTSPGTSTVTFNGTPGVISSADWTATSIVALVPRGATSGNVVVTVGGFASNGLPFTVTVPPNISIVSPNNGPVGTSVQIGGSNFGATQGTSTVTFNGTAATPTSWSDTQIVVPVPSGATTGNIIVTVAGLTASGGVFTVIVPPNITNLSPTTGSVGASVTIGGTNFGATQSSSTVAFNGTAATPASWSSTGIVVPVPVGATTGNVVVTVNGLPSNGAPFTVNPISVSVSPTTVTLGTGGQQIFSFTVQNDSLGNGVTWALSGAGCSGGACGTIQPFIGGPGEVYNAPAVAPNPSTVTLTATSVTDPTKSASATITVNQTMPNISTLSPTSGPAGTTVSITGTNFGPSPGTSTVTFNGTAASPTNWSPTSIIVIVPSGATTGNVVVTVGGFPSNGVAFTVTNQPNITGISPALGPVGTSVTITGTNFGASQGTSTVTFSSVAGTPVSWSATTIVVPVPAGVAAGSSPVIVVVGGIASSQSAFVVTPRITSLNPSSGPIGTSITISGSNFGAAQGSSTVTFNGTSASPTTWSDTSILVPVPSGATTGSLVVTVGPGSISSASAPFTVTATITNLFPNSGLAGTNITISGINFGATQGTSTITFNGVPATAISWSNTSIFVQVPPGATTGNVVVNVGGSVSNGVLFTVPPNITSLNPGTGPVGSTVTIGGNNFGTTQGTSTVTFNGTLATPTSWSATSIVVSVPSGATTGNVFVTLAGVPSNGLTFTIGPDVTPPTPPSNLLASPYVGLDIALSWTLSTDNVGVTNYLIEQCQGTGCTNFTQNQPIPGNIVPFVSLGPLSPATSYSFRMRARDAAGNLSGYSNVASATTNPTGINFVNPNLGIVGSTVTISGAGFGATQGTSTVTFNGTPANPTSWNDTSITAPVPSGASSGNVVVTTAAGTSNGVPFTIVPNISSLSPTSGPVGSMVTINGAGFGASQGNNTITFNGTSATASWSDTSIVASVPIGATSGNVVVTVAGQASNGVLFTVLPPTPNIVFLTPASGPVGTSVWVVGSNFGTVQGTSTITFNGTPATPISWIDSRVIVPVPTGATTGSVVVTVGGVASNGPTFTVIPSPTITGMTPSSAIAGGGPLTIAVTGTNFVSSSTVQWNGNALATTFVSSAQLQAQVTPTNIASMGAARVTVSNASIGGGVSNASTFFVGTTGGSNFAAIVVNQAAQDIVYDPTNQVFYLSVPGTASSNPNTIAVLDPATATITSTQPTGNNPNVLAVSDDSQFLYAGIDGTSTVQRFILPSLTPDISYPLGSNFFGPFFALDLQVAPSASHTTAVSLGNSGTSPAAQGGVTIFDDATPRATNAPGGSNLFGSIQWGADGATLFASNTETSSYDFYTLTVNSGGVTLNQDFQSEFDLSGNSIHFDRSTNLIYSDDGQVINPATGLPVGNFNATRVMVADAALNAAFFANTNSSSEVTMASFDLTHFTPINSVTLANVTGQAGHLIRWGQNGLAFINNSFSGTNQIVLVGGDFVSAAPPFVSTPPPAPVLPPVPAPNAPTIGSLNPSSSVAGSAAFVLNVTGTQFDPAATVQFNGSALSTTYVSSTQLQALIPASAVASPGTASVVVANPSASGGNSGSAAFFVGLTGGTSSTGAGFAAQIVNLPSKQIAFDPASQRFYLSVPNSAATGNTIAVLDPTRASIIGQQFAGSNPDAIAISDDGQYLYAGIDGSSSVQRFQLPGLATDISYSLGPGPYPSGPFFALDLQVAPGSPHTTAVTRGAFNSGPQATGGIEIFDDASARPVIAKGFGSGGGGSALYDSLQWGADTTVLFASNTEDSLFDFYTLSVTASGVSQTTDKMNAFSSFRDKIHFDRGTQLIYADDGQVLNPSTGALVGTFSVPGPPVMVPDSSLNLAFFAIQTGSSSVGIYSFNLSTFAPVSSITIPNVNGNPIRLIRWGQNGLALNTDAGQIVLVGGNFVH